MGCRDARQASSLTENGGSVIGAPPSAIDRLLLAGDARVGALSFGIATGGPLLHKATAPIRDLAEVEVAMVALDAGLSSNDDVRLLGAGISLGGARPKCTARMQNGSLRIAKFRRRRSDTFDAVRAEMAAMTLARTSGINAAETGIATLGQHEALLVRAVHPRASRHRYGRKLPGDC